MLTLRELRKIVDEVEYRDWDLVVREDGNDGRPYLQVQFVACDAVTRRTEEWSGRKWFLSPHMTRSEVVQTAFKAIMTAAEHEVRENFLWRDRAIFGPHLDVEALWAISTVLDERS
jgi:hypothetical protein